MSEQVTNRAELRDGGFPETLLCSMLGALDDNTINFSLANKVIPLCLERKHEVAAQSELRKEIHAHCAQLGLLGITTKSVSFSFWLHVKSRLTPGMDLTRCSAQPGDVGAELAAYSGA